MPGYLHSTTSQPYEGRERERVGWNTLPLLCVSTGQGGKVGEGGGRSRFVGWFHLFRSLATGPSAVSRIVVVGVERSRKEEGWRSKDTEFLQLDLKTLTL